MGWAIFKNFFFPQASSRQIQIDNLFLTSTVNLCSDNDMILHIL
jgi:hypothetical protein